jgi:peptide deformylase
MAILKLARMGHPILGKVAEPINDPLAPEIQRLIADMEETLEDEGGVGLAAPQVHVSLRLILFSVPAGRGGEGSPEIPVTALINPEIEVLDPETDAAMEACLSLPDMAGQVARPRRNRYRALGADGKTIEAEAEGFHARVLQHEIDHLDGILYPMRMTDLTTFGYVDALKKR